MVLQRDSYKCVSCGVSLSMADAHVHHLMPRSMGGEDELSNLVTLCHGCHASFHPMLAGRLARRWFEAAAIRLARWLDRTGSIADATNNLGPALRLFGLNAFRSGQLPIILAALSGKSILVVSPTGSGKTLCFQLPAVLRRGTSIVVSPLKALMTEQVSALLRKKVPATFINSDLSVSEKEVRFSWLSQGAVKLLYLAPERFFVQSEQERKNLKAVKPSFLVVDEAHCVDQWGRDFRREYSRLNEVREKLGAPPVLAFTATAGKEMQGRILSSLGIPDAQIFVRDIDRPNIALLRWRCPEDVRPAEIASILALRALRNDKVMIFVPTRKVGEALQASLRGLLLELPFYHSQMGTAWEREQLLKRFVGEARPAVNQIICTNAFGMGLDIPNVRLVIHWQQSASIEDLFQELGRAGRDQKPSASVIFHDRKSHDVSRLKYMAELTVSQSVTEPHQSEALNHRLQQIEQVSRALTQDGCFRSEIRNYFGSEGPRNRASLSETILNWVFGSSIKTPDARICCDHCNSRQIKKVGLKGVLSLQLEGRLLRK